MKSKSKDSKRTVAGKKASLKHVIKRNRKIKESVKQAADELTSVNETLKQGKEAIIPVQIVNEAITQNEEVEQKVAKAADDLHQVNTELVKEVTERALIETDFSDMKKELNDVRDDLSKSQAKEEESRKTSFQEVTERALIETELSDMKKELADVRDDLSKSQAKEEESRKASFYDALTGLPNRTLFEERLEQGLIQAKRRGLKLAVLFLDIDNFKNINDSYGHDVGDKVLLTVADRLQSASRKEDTVSRWAGDEFVCLLLEVKQEAEVVRLAELFVTRISEPLELKETVLSIRVSIGIAVYPADGVMAETLFKNADTAMYKAKGTEMRVVLFRDSAL